MKKLVVAILAIFYISLASGVMVNVHYCMGQLASVDYGHDDHDKCGRCGMPDDGNACCHTDSKLVKLQDDHQLSATAFHCKQVEALPSFNPVYTAAIILPQQPVTSGGIYSPPDDPPHTIYLYNCVFRI